MSQFTATIPGLTLGIIGGGQLGRMMCLEARRLGIRTAVLDPAEHPPAEGLADICLRGGLTNPAALRRLAGSADILTYEIEHINADELNALEAEGMNILPSPRVLMDIQDKLRQKRLLADAGLPVPRFAAFEGPSEGGTAGPAAAEELRAFGLPCIQKIRTGGYDGRGVALIGNLDAELLPGPSMLEERVDFAAELAVLLARSASGEIRTYPVIEMVFDPATQICNSVCVPARISPQLARRAKEVSAAAVETLNGVGIFAVELFLGTSGDVLINEIAPRPHNSGHWSIEGAATSQFEQHLRAVCGLPLGSAELVSPAVMVNLLGAPGAGGAPRIAGYEALLAEDRCYLHWYGKREVRPNRKMGHFTVLDEDLETALRRAADLEKRVSIVGTPKA
jgi:5-(carboxyamino)imidazole ribonucleotide synthase